MRRIGRVRGPCWPRLITPSRTPHQFARCALDLAVNPAQLWRNCSHWDLLSYPKVHNVMSCRCPTCERQQRAPPVARTAAAAPRCQAGAATSHAWTLSVRLWQRRRRHCRSRCPRRRTATPPSVSSSSAGGCPLCDSCAAHAWVVRLPLSCSQLQPEIMHAATVLLPVERQAPKSHLSIFCVVTQAVQRAAARELPAAHARRGGADGGAGGPGDRVPAQRPRLPRRHRERQVWPAVCGDGHRLGPHAAQGDAAAARRQVSVLLRAPSPKTKARLKSACTNLHTEQSHRPPPGWVRRYKGMSTLAWSCQRGQLKQAHPPRPLRIKPIRPPPSGRARGATAWGSWLRSSWRT